MIGGSTLGDHDSGIIRCSHRPAAGREILDTPQSREYRISVRKKFGRRPLRLSRVFDSSPLYFVTFCTHNRIRCLARDEIHSAFILFARRAEQDFNVAVGRYVIMPDHIHLFVRGGGDFKLGRWIGLLKQTLARAARTRSANARFWREGVFDHVCGVTRVIQKNGITFAKIRCGPDLRSRQNNGRTRERSFTSIARDY